LGGETKYTPKTNYGGAAAIEGVQESVWGYYGFQS